MDFRTPVRTESVPQRVRISITTRPSKHPSGDLPVYLRVEAAGKTAYMALGLNVGAKEWNPNEGRRRGKGRDIEAFNAHLSSVEARANRIALDQRAAGQPLTARAIRDAVRESMEPRAETGGVAAFMQQVADEFRSRGSEGTARKYEVSMRRVLDYLKASRYGTTLRWEGVTPRFIRGMENWLRAAPPAGRGCAINTTEKYLAVLRSSFREAARRGLTGDTPYPFEHVTLRREKVTKPSLSAAEVDAIAAVTGLSKWQALARDLWLFAFYAGGMRFSDVVLLKWSAVRFAGPGEAYGRVTYSMGKTGERQDLALVPQALAVLARYRPPKPRPDAFIFPIIRSLTGRQGQKVSLYTAVNTQNAHVNRLLKEIAAVAGVEKRLTFHMSRHSLARYLLDKGFDVYAIKEVLRHSSVRVTEGYLAGIDRERLNDSYGRAFE